MGRFSVDLAAADTGGPDIHGRVFQVPRKTRLV